MHTGLLVEGNWSWSGDDVGSLSVSGLPTNLEDGAFLLLFLFNGPLRQYFSLYLASPRER